MPPRARNDSQTATRGRRRPELLEPDPAQQLGEPLDGQDDGGNDAEYDSQEFDTRADDQLNDPGNFQPDELPALYPGDVITAKSSVTLDIMGHEAWITYGVSSRVQPHESEEDAFIRVGGVIAERVVDLAAAQEQSITGELERQREAARRRPIRPRIN